MRWRNLIRKSSPVALALTIITELAMAQSAAPSRNLEQPLLTRNYVAGQHLAYRMTASNRRPGRTTSYEAIAEGVVKQDSAGHFYEEYRWSGVAFAGKAVELPPDSARLVQRVSLSPSYALAMPDLSRVPPALIGSVTDFLGFYVDVRLAGEQPELRRPGDHVVVRHGKANSWADGNRILLGEDAIDFDIAIENVDDSAGVVTVRVRHVPPEQPEIKIPADWMREPVADVPNNWVQVSRTRDGKYRAGVGKETFDVEIKLSLIDGSIVSIRMDNPVTISERECEDEALTQCGDATRYQIVRVVEISRVQWREEGCIELQDKRMQLPRQPVTHFRLTKCTSRRL